MALRLGDAHRALDALRIEPSPKRVRALLDGRTAVDTRRGVLVWEPRRVTPAYAVPVDELSIPLREDTALRAPDLSALPPVWDPSVPFAVRTTLGRPVALGDEDRQASGFLPDDPDLDGYVLLDFDGFTWREDEDEVIAHPHDPFSRIDVRTSTSEYVLSWEGHVVARTTDARVLYETGLPARLYWPRESVVAELRPSPTRSRCAYKGEAEYFSVEIGGRTLDDAAWTYPRPLIDGEPVGGRIAFYEERMDLEVDGRRRPRPASPFS